MLAGVGVPAPAQVYAIVAPITAAPSLRVAVIVKTCETPTGFVADPDTVTSYASHVFDVSTGGTTRSVAGSPPTVVAAISVTVKVNVPGPAVSHEIRARACPTVPLVAHVDAAVSIVPGPDVVAVNVVPSAAGNQVMPSSDCSTVAVNVCGTPTRLVAAGDNDTRYPNHVFVAVNGSSWDVDRPMVDPPSVRSTVNAPSVRPVTVNVPSPGLRGRDRHACTHPPCRSYTTLAGVAVPAPVHVYAIDAPSTGSASLRVAVIVNTCSAPFTGLTADGDTVTSYANHVFDVSTGGTGKFVTGVPSIVVPAISVTLSVNVPGPASVTTYVHVPPTVPPVTHVEVLVSSVPVPDEVAVNVVPSGTAVHVVPSADCSTVAVNVCGTPTKFVADASNVTRYASHVFDVVNGTT